MWRNFSTSKFEPPPPWQNQKSAPMSAYRQKNLFVNTLPEGAFSILQAPIWAAVTGIYGYKWTKLYRATVGGAGGHVPP